MPATVTPTSYLAGLKLVTSNSDGSADASDFANSTEYICIPLSSLPELSSAEANPSTGDMRKIMFAFETAIYNSYQAITFADRPTKWVSTRSESFSSGGIAITRTFVNQIITGISGEEVAAE
jgi:hypothetical protein